MLGAIIGDIIGSVYENIPKLPIRQTEQMTDDSFLTLAALNWMTDLDLSKFKYLFDKNKSHQNREFVLIKQEIFNNAEKNLLKWYDIGIKENINQNNLIPAFSPGFDNWVLAKNNKIISKIKYNSNTNGCLMRNSPISFIGHSKSLSLEHVLELTKIFCLTTHTHEDSLHTTEIHSSLLYLIYSKVINSSNIKNILSKENSIITSLHPNLISIKPLDFWIPKEKDVLDNPKLKFLWDSKNSLNIALSAIYYSKSFKETMDFCNATNMDTDTYCAIAGPIAEGLWGIDLINMGKGMKIINLIPEANQLINKTIKVHYFNII
ncbi:hypothetical protein GW796_00105 [archaeon]|nr:hypothetical protein [archaeon]